MYALGKPGWRNPPSLKVIQIEQIFQPFACFSETLDRSCLEIRTTLLWWNADQRTSPTSNLLSPDPHARRLCFQVPQECPIYAQIYKFLKKFRRHFERLLQHNGSYVFCSGNPGREFQSSRAGTCWRSQLASGLKPFFVICPFVSRPKDSESKWVNFWR